MPSSTLAPTRASATVEVAFAVAVLVVSVVLVAALLRETRERTPDVRIVAAFAADEDRAGGSSPEGGQPPIDRREE